MAKPKMYGINKKYIPNCRADLKRNKLFRSKKGNKK